MSADSDSSHCIPHQPERMQHGWRPQPKRQTVPSSASQADKFADAAHALGCDEDEAAFKEKLGRDCAAEAERRAGAKKLRRG